jgi:sulfite reductase (NADPH) hemoprotein beta-component
MAILAMRPTGVPPVENGETGRAETALRRMGGTPMPQNSRGAFFVKDVTNPTGVANEVQPKAPAGARLRAKILGGELTAPLWRALAQAASQFTPGVPLHLTTRQDVELHGLAESHIPAVQKLLAEVGLTAKQACGNTVRNITVCPCSGVRTGMPILAPLAWQVRKELEAIEGGLNLPRKFKISFSACPEACGQPWVNDLGLVAVRDGNAWAFSVIVAGSLGARPAAGILFAEALPAGDVPPLAVAALRVFATHADRKNRSTARLRHVRQRLGDEAFVNVLREAFQQAKSQRNWPAIELPELMDGFDTRLPVTFLDGNMSPREAQALADLAERAELRVRIDNHHRVILAGKDEPALRRALAGLPALAEAARPQALVVACPGRRWCKNGLIDTAALAARLRQALGAGAPSGMLVGISGCPSNCSHSSVADIGIIGGRSSAGGQPGEKFTVLAGGGSGRTGALAKPVASGLSADETVAEVVRLARTARER